jgi:hypothetical protein
MNRSNENAFPSRRQFLQLGGAAALACAASNVSADETAPKANTDTNRGNTLNVSNASYSLRAFSLDKAIEMTKRAGIKNNCPKSMHRSQITVFAPFCLRKSVPRGIILVESKPIRLTGQVGG